VVYPVKLMKHVCGKNESLLTLFNIHKQILYFCQITQLDKCKAVTTNQNYTSFPMALYSNG